VPKKRKASAPLVPLTGKQKSYLRSLAHKLKPVVQIGHQGLTDGVLAAIEVALERHELIKLKVTGEANIEATELAPQVEKATKSQLAQIIGHTVVLYRRRPENPKISLPRIKPAKPAAAKPGPAAAYVEDFDGDDDDEDEDDDVDLEDADDDDDLE
jgi:RNA-binding protein